MNGLKNLHIFTLFLIPMLIFAFLPGQLRAQEPLKTGTTGASFLELGVGARGIAMGDAYVAIAEGANGAYWNPAGPGMLSDIEASFMQMNYVVDIDLQNVALVIPLPGIITFGGMITNLAVPDDKIRTLEDPEGERGKQASDRGCKCLPEPGGRGTHQQIDPRCGLQGTHRSGPGEDRRRGEELQGKSRYGEGQGRHPETLSGYQGG